MDNKNSATVTVIKKRLEKLIYYIKSGGRDSSLGRKSVSNYISKSLGGSSNATQRMGAARNSTARLLNIAGAFASGGARAVEQYLSIENLSHKTASEAFIAITDFICPDGGPQDEGIARSAYICAIEESPEIATIKFEDLTAEQIVIIVERTMANAIFIRITNDIGNKVILLPQDRTTSDSIIVQMKDFVKGYVSDAVANLDIQAGNIWQGESLRIVDQVYKEAFEIMVSAGENEYIDENGQRILPADFDVKKAERIMGNFLNYHSNLHTTFSEVVSYLILRGTGYDGGTSSRYLCYLLGVDSGDPATLKNWKRRTKR